MSNQEEDNSNILSFKKNKEILLKEAQEKYEIIFKEDEFRYKIKQENSISFPNNINREKSIVKVQKLVNKLKRFNENDKNLIINELMKVDISMHLSEVCDSICDSEIRFKDINSLVELCSICFRIYGFEFSNTICCSTLRSFRNSCDISIPANILRRRTIPKFLFELILVGICQETDSLPKIINDLTDTNNLSSDTLSQLNLSIIEMLCRKFETAMLDLTNTPKQEELNKLIGKQIIRKCSFSKNVQIALKNKLIDYYKTTASIFLLQAEEAVKNQSKINQQRKIAKGSVDTESETKYQNLLNNLNRIKTQIYNLGQILNVTIPNVLEDKQDITRMINTTSENNNNNNNIETSLEKISIWENDTEKDFYENILNLADAVPSSLLGVNIKETNIMIDSPPPLSQQIQQSQTINSSESNLQQQQDILINLENISLNDLNQNELNIIQQQIKTNVDRKILLLDQFFENLCKTTLGSEVDQLAIKFFYDQLNSSKNCRKRLIKLCVSSHRNDLFVLPIISRFLATINLYCKDIVPSVIERVLNDFNNYINLKDSLKIESFIKTARFLTELCKFNLLPTGTIIEIMQQLLEDFNFLNVEIVCHMIQSCGKFLLNYNGLLSKFQNTIITKLLRIKNFRNLPVHLEVMIQDSYYQLFPSEKSKLKKKNIPIVRQYINYLISLDSTENNKVVHIIKSIRSLNWNDPIIYKWFMKAIKNTINNSTIAFPMLNNIGSILCALAPIHPDVVINCIDDLCESIQIGIERNDFWDMPSRYREIKLLGEVFNYRLIDSKGILDTLYHLIGFGGPSSFGCSCITTFRKIASQTNPYLLQRPYIEDDNIEKKPLVESSATNEPQDEYFRIRLVCNLLQTSGHVFNKGIAKDKMDLFLAFFQRYIYFKRPIPCNIENVIVDVLRYVRPKYNLKYDNIIDIDRLINEYILKIQEFTGVETKDIYEDTEILQISQDEVISNVGQLEDHTETSSETVSEILSDTSLDELKKARLDQMEADMLDLEIANIISQSAKKVQVYGPRIKPIDPIIRVPNLNKIVSTSINDTTDVPPNSLRIKLITKKGKDKITVKPLDIPKECRLSQALYHKETEDAEEHAKLKKFVLDSVVRCRKQEVTAQESDLRRHLFTVPWGPSNKNNKQTSGLTSRYGHNKTNRTK